MRELCKLAIVLTVICCGAALSLAYVYNLTKEPIAYQQRLKKIKAINSVFPGHESSSEPDTVEMSAGKNKKGEDITRKFYVIKKDETVSGVAFEIAASGYGGNIKIMVGVAKDAIITGIKIIGHTETPGLGANVTKESFYQQFKGKDLNDTNWDLKKNGGDVDQVSGATISSTAVMKAVHDGLNFFSEHKEQILASEVGT